MRMLLDLIGRIFSYLSTKADDTDVVHNTNDETIAGVKTFSEAPIVPDPTEDTQIANKAYVDALEMQTTFDNQPVVNGYRTLVNDGNFEICKELADGSYVNFIQTNNTNSLQTQKYNSTTGLIDVAQIGFGLKNGIWTGVFGVATYNTSSLPQVSKTFGFRNGDLALEVVDSTGETETTTLENILTDGAAHVATSAKLGTVKLATSLDDTGASSVPTAAMVKTLTPQHATYAEYGTVRLGDANMIGIDGAPVGLDQSESLRVELAYRRNPGEPAIGAVSLPTLYAPDTQGSAAGFKTANRGVPFIPSATQDRYGVVKIAENLDDTTEGAVPSVAMVKGTVFPDYTSDATVSLTSTEMLAGYTLTFDAFVVAKCKKSSVKIIVGSAEKILSTAFDNGGAIDFTFYAKAGSTITVSEQWSDWSCTADVYPLNG